MGLLPLPTDPPALASPPDGMVAGVRQCLGNAMVWLGYASLPHGDRAHPPLSLPGFLRKWCCCDGVPPLLPARPSQEHPEGIKLQEIPTNDDDENQGLSRDAQLPLWRVPGDSPRRETSSIGGIWGPGLAHTMLGKVPVVTSTSASSRRGKKALQ